MRGGPINADLTLNGQGNTHLGYVAYTTPVFVDVQTGQATDVKGGFSGISTITGGSDVNILVGDGTENLNGAPGSQNLIISGGGSGLTLTGGGGAGDILIDGTTAYDADANGELEAILAEWTSGGNYSDIVAHIIAGDTDVDPYPLDNTSVFDNGAQNTLIGHPQGGGLNLYYVTNNTSDDATPDETVIDVSRGPAPHGGATARFAALAAASLSPTEAADVHFRNAIALQQSLTPRAAPFVSQAKDGNLVAHTTSALGPSLAADLAWSEFWQPSTQWNPDLG
jgi:hypothetical protein